MKVYVLLGLLVVGIAAEKKLNLEDIERDNLRSESNTKSENLRVEETKYLTKSDLNQQHYDLSSHYTPPTTTAPQYVPAEQSQPAKYNAPSEIYLSTNRYAVKEPAYQDSASAPQQHNIPLQYYTTYQEQLPQQVKGHTPNVYESQVVYQPEVSVGNQLQSVQQKAITEKYTNNVHKEAIYADIPMSQLLAYYPNLEISSGRNGGLSGQAALNQLATAAAQQISIPVYTPAFSQKPIVHTKPSYQVHYTAGKHSTAVPATFTTKISKGSVYSPPSPPKKYMASSALVNYVPAEQSYNQGKKLLYTQAYLAPQQHQHQQQYVPSFVYSQPAAYYTHATPVYTDLFARAPASAYVQDNSLHAGSQTDYSGQSQQLYLGQADGEHLSKQFLRQQVSHDSQHNYVQVPEEPTTHFIPPRLPAQEFKSGVTQLVPVPSEEESHPVQHHHGVSEPRSLLESYVPSNIIAAQDAARYRERPLKLEGGFLPSKENFIHKKRKAE